MRFEGDGFFEFSQSSSIVQRAIALTSRDTLRRALDDLLGRHAPNGSFIVQYRTTVVTAVCAHPAGD